MSQLEVEDVSLVQPISRPLEHLMPVDLAEPFTNKVTSQDIETSAV